MSRHDIPEASRISPKVRLGPAGSRGAGLFAVEAIDTGEVVLVWGGPSYTDADGARRAREAGLGGMQWDDDVFSVETHPMEDAFRVNHSCDPNIWMDGAFTLTARRDITAGEELLVDYAVMLDDENHRSTWDCTCDSPLCRGRVTGADWKLPALREAYRGHFTPILEKRIAASEAGGQSEG